MPIARTFEYPESGLCPPVDALSAYRVDAHMDRKSGQYSFECFRVIDDCLDSVACIPYRSGYAGPDAGITNEGSESDSLDDADDGETGKSLSHIPITVLGFSLLGKTKNDASWNVEDFFDEDMVP